MIYCGIYLLRHYGSDGDNAAINRSMHRQKKSPAEAGLKQDRCAFSSGVRQRASLLCLGLEEVEKVCHLLAILQILRGDILGVRDFVLHRREIFESVGDIAHGILLGKGEDFRIRRCGFPGIAREDIFDHAMEPLVVFHICPVLEIFRRRAREIDFLHRASVCVSDGAVPLTLALYYRVIRFERIYEQRVFHLLRHNRSDGYAYRIFRHLLICLTYLYISVNSKLLRHFLPAYTQS